MGKSNSEEKKSITNVQNLYKKAKSLERQLLLDNFISYKCTKYNIFFLNFGYTNILFVDYTFLRWFGPPMKFLSLDLASSYQKLLIQVHGCNSIPQIFQNSIHGFETRELDPPILKKCSHVELPFFMMCSSHHNSF